MPSWRIGLLLTFLLSASAVFAQESDSLDEDLFNQLTEGLDLGEAKDEPKPEPGKGLPGEKPTEEPVQEESPSQPEVEEVIENTKPLEQDADQNFTGEGPLDEIGRRMRSVERRLQVADSGKQTQQVQSEILQQLEELLKLQKQKKPNPQSSQSQSQSQQQQASRDTPQQPDQQPQESNSAPRDNAEGQPENQNPNQVEESTDRQQPQTTIESEAFADRFADYLQAEWGHLPVRERNMVIQSFRERFLPQYDQMIRDYYERLAKERPQIP